MGAIRNAGYHLPPDLLGGAAAPEQDLPVSPLFRDIADAFVAAKVNVLERVRKEHRAALVNQARFVHAYHVASLTGVSRTVTIPTRAPGARVSSARMRWA
jgi:hypothetical protein